MSLVIFILLVAATAFGGAQFEPGDWYDAAKLENGRAQVAQLSIVRLALLHVPRGSADDSSVLTEVPRIYPLVPQQLLDLNLIPSLQNCTNQKKPYVQGYKPTDTSYIGVRSHRTYHLGQPC